MTSFGCFIEWAKTGKCDGGVAARFFVEETTPEHKEISASSLA